MRRRIHIRGDLIDPWERMQHRQVLARTGEILRAHAIRPGDRAILCLIGEALTLDPGHVQHVQLLQAVIDIRVLMHGDPGAVEVIADVCGQLQGGWGDEVLDHIEPAERGGQRVDRPPILEVADDPDCDVIQAHRLIDGVQVQQRLCRVLACPVARVDDRHIDELAGDLRGALRWVPEDDRICIPLDHTDGVCEALPLLDRRGVDATHVDHPATESLHSRSEAHPGPGRWLEEQQPQQPVCESVLMVRRRGSNGRCGTEHLLDVVAGQRRRTQDVLWRHHHCVRPRVS
jgi:hypothetical protein